MISFDSDDASSVCSMEILDNEKVDPSLNWRQQITSADRNEFVKSLVTVIQYETDPSCLLKVELSHLMTYAKKVENEIFESAGSCEEYDRRNLEKIQMVKKLKPENLREKLLGVATSESLADEKIQKSDSDSQSEQNSRSILDEINGVWKLVAQDNAEKYNMATYGSADYSKSIGKFLKIDINEEYSLISAINESKDLEFSRFVSITSKSSTPTGDYHDFIDKNQWFTINEKLGYWNVAQLVDGQLRIDHHWKGTGSYTNVYERVQNIKVRSIVDTMRLVLLFYLFTLAVLIARVGKDGFDAFNMLLTGFAVYLVTSNDRELVETSQFLQKIFLQKAKPSSLQK